LIFRHFTPVLTLKISGLGFIEMFGIGQVDLFCCH